MSETFSTRNEHDETSDTDAEIVGEADRSIEVTRIGNDLFRDFYQSFRLSQGDADTQQKLFDLLTEEHVNAGQQSILPEAVAVGRSRVDRLEVPKKHGIVPEENIQKNGFQTMWEKYEARLVGPQQEGSDELAIEADQLSREITYDMIAKDTRYVHYVPRPRSDPSRGEDNRQSILREYVIGDELHGSEQLMAVRDRLRTEVTTIWNQAYSPDMANRELFLGLHCLADYWEVKHPGENFAANLATESDERPYIPPGAGSPPGMF